jgi:membrane protein DedA with SNARE-associated domain
MDPKPWLDLATSAGVFLLTFLSEDSATLTGGLLVALGKLSWPLAFASCFFGIWLGDLGLYALARLFGRPAINRFWPQTASGRLSQSEAWFNRHGPFALIICRFIPGTRLPTFLAAGLLRMPMGRFALMTGLLAAGWVGLAFLILREFGAEAAGILGTSHAIVLAAVVLALIVTRNRWLSVLRRLSKSPAIQRWRQWEFWPAWFFYLPIGLNYLRLSIRYRSLSLPTCANPGMFTGGLIGESKYETLRALSAGNPGWVAESVLIGEGELRGRMASLKDGIQSACFDFPIVLKPDVAQRGSGFRVLKTAAEAEAYLREVNVPVIAQRYIPGPHEAGIFYYRFPTGGTGRIFAITEKVFPTILGDGERTLEELIRADSRAAIIAKTYLRRFAHRRDCILAPGQALRLVEAGNHAQGCIFRDGMRFWSRQLEERINAISGGLPGFYVGRYDVRFASVEQFTKGEGFKILELNGAASEATSAYDSSKSLGDAYRILFGQWELVFAIGDQNRRLGYRGNSLGRIVSEWLRYREYSLCHPLAD